MKRLLLVAGMLCTGAALAQAPPRLFDGAALALGHVADVVTDLRLGREGAGPVRVRGEGERIDVAGHVAGAARVVVVPPGAAWVRGPLEDHEVLAARAAQLRTHRDAGEAGADDRHLDLGWQLGQALGLRCGCGDGAHRLLSLVQLTDP